MTNTERLIMAFEHGLKYGHVQMVFTVGRYTGNGVAVVPALRRKGFKIVRNIRTCPQSYTMSLDS